MKTTLPKKGTPVPMTPREAISWLQNYVATKQAASRSSARSLGETAKTDDAKAGQLAQDIALFAKMEGCETPSLVCFIRKRQQIDRSALLRELSAIHPGDVDRSLRRLQNVPACENGFEEEGTWPRVQSQERAADLRRRFTPAERARLARIYIDHISWYCERNGLDAKIIRDFLAVPESKRHHFIPSLFAWIIQTQMHLETSPDTQTCYGLQLALLAVDMLVTRIESAGTGQMPDEWNSAYAYKAYTSLVNAWEWVVKQQDANPCWRQLEAWKYLEEMTSRIIPAQGAWGYWPDQWQRLKAALQKSQRLQVEDFQLCLKTTLFKVREGLLSNDAIPVTGTELTTEAQDLTPIQAAIEVIVRNLGGDPKRAFALLQKATWLLTVTEVAVLALVDKGVVSRAVDSGKLPSNGKVGRQRRIPIVFALGWILDRRAMKERCESNAHVQRLMDQHKPPADKSSALLVTT